ncbi:MAG TPA: DNA repair protein RadC [Planctomycetota bacterium]|nr:DNA repair protein RadC [Planctomycetota bacterium]
MADGESTVVMPDARQALALVRRRLRAEAGDALAPFLRSVLSRPTGGRGLPLGEDHDVRRFLFRLGWLGSDRGTAANARKVDALVTGLAREAREEGLAVGLMLRLFASGERAIGAEPVCGEMPRCQGCELAELCRSRREALAAPEPAETERPAERFVREGEETLTASELAALVLSGPGLSEPRALAAARRLLGRAGSLRDLAAMPLGELAAVEGLNPDLAMRLRAALALARRWSTEQREPGRRFRTGRDFFEFFAPRLRDLKQECFEVVLLDQKNGYLGSQRVSAGSLTGALVHPREVFRPAIREAAAAVAFVHNHPSGDPKPSKDDIELTARLVDVAKLVGVRVLDHVVVGDGGYFSFVEEGLI